MINKELDYFVTNHPRQAVTMDIILRSGRQITLPLEACEALDLREGDSLKIEVANGGLFVKPKKALALSHLHEVQAAFADSDVSEEELQEEGRRIRESLSRARYGRE